MTSGAELADSAVLRFDARTGAFLGVFASGHGLHRPYGLTFSDDGLLYVASFLSDEIFRFDGWLGACAGTRCMARTSIRRSAPRTTRAAGPGARRHVSYCTWYVALR